MNDEHTLKLLEKLKSLRDYVEKYENKKRFIGAHRQSILSYEKKKEYALKMLQEYTDSVQSYSELIEVGIKQIEQAEIWCNENEKNYIKLKARITEDEAKLLLQVEKIQGKIKESQDDTEP